jgi:chaperone BCS1
MFTQAFQFVMDQIGQNDLLAGGAILGALAFLLNYLRTLPLTILYWCRLAFVTHMDVPDRAASFKWVSAWLAQHKYMKSAKRLTIESESGKPIVTPAPGRHLVWWGWRPIILNRVRREGTGDNAHRAFREAWSITMFGKREGIESFIEECRKASRKDADDFIEVADVGEHGYWNKSIRRRKRPIGSVILPTGIRNRLMDDVHEFINSKDWYIDMNIPWRRGYLLSGPPGNGKSSLITAVASEIDFEIMSLNFGQIGEEELVTLMSDVKENCILLLEDIDCAFVERANRTPISMSTLLNLLDGVNASEGRLVFMTTNHPEKLDPALIRPGRIDLHIELPDATPYQIAQLYKRFYPESRNADDFAARVVKYKPSMARLQGYFLEHRNSVKRARANIKELANAEVSDLEQGLQERELSGGHDVCGPT